MTDHEQPPITDADIRFVEDNVHGVTNAEILWGGPRGEGIVYVVERLLKVTGELGESVASLASSVAALQKSDIERTKRERAGDLRRQEWSKGTKRLAWLLGSAIMIPALKSIYTFIQPIAVHHGWPLPAIESGVKVQLSN